MRGFMVDRPLGVLRTVPVGVTARCPFAGAGGERPVRPGVLQAIIELSTLVDLQLGVKLDDRPRDSHRIQAAATLMSAGISCGPQRRGQPPPNGVTDTATPPTVMPAHTTSKYLRSVWAASWSSIKSTTSFDSRGREANSGRECGRLTCTGPAPRGPAAAADPDRR